MELSIVQQAYKDSEKIRTQFEYFLKPHREMLRQLNAQTRPAFEAAERINRPVREIQGVVSHFSRLSHALDFETRTIPLPPRPADKDPELIADLIAKRIYEMVSKQKPHSIEKKKETIAFIQTSVPSASMLEIPKGTQWTDIEIMFLTYERIAISIGKKVFEKNRKKLGFALQKSKGTPKIWNLFFYFAVADGVLNWESYAKNPLLRTLTQEEIFKLKKRKSLLSKVLRNIFTISENPFFAYGKSQGYATRFSITLSKNFRKQLLSSEKKMGYEDAEDNIGIHEEFRRLTNT